jgi:hypothetical protein
VGTLCPACGAAGDVGAEGSCPWCGIDWRGPEAKELRRLAAQVDALDRELWEVGERRNRLAVELGNRRWVATRGARQPDRQRPPSLWGRPADVGAPRSAEWTVDRVRSVLLWVGATLLTASALTFTTVAWAHLGDGGRALLLAAVTVLCVGSALGLRRRLPATAEAFTALSIALVAIDWQALRRAGVTEDMSVTASWAIGSLIVSIAAFALGTAVGKRTTRVAIALLVPLSVELAIATFSGAVWGFALGFALVAGAAALARGQLRGYVHHRPVGMALMVHVITTWSIAAILAAIATAQAHSLAMALVPGAIVLSLTLAPLALLRSDSAPRDFTALATLVCALVASALVVVASTTFGPQGMLAWAAIVGSAAIVIAPSLPRRWMSPAWTAGGGFGVAGLAYGTTAALTAVLGPLGWLSHAWQGSLTTPARAVFAGPHPTTTWSFGWPSVFALIAIAFAITAIAVPTRRRQALVPVSRAFGSVATLATLAACTAPVVSGASVRVACVSTTVVLFALLLGGVALDRSRPRLGVAVLPVAILPALATTGWAALTPTTSIVVLGLACIVGVCATAVAASQEARSALGAFCGACAITLAGAATAAGSDPAAAGFAVALAAGVVVLLGVHGRLRMPEGVALEVVGATGVVVGVAITAQSAAWFAGGLTALTPMLLVASVRRERRVLYSVAAGAAAVGATWAWLAAAHVSVVEAYTAPAAAFALGVGLLEWRRGPARSWLALGPAIVLGLGPTLLLGIGRDDTARTIIAAVLAFAIVGLGAWKQLQAPLVLGSLALLTLAVDTFGPALARLPRWLPLAIIGLLLMWIGATFETRRNRAKSATESLMQFG